jgi:hypothetical protein
MFQQHKMHPMSEVTSTKLKISRTLIFLKNLLVMYRCEATNISMDFQDRERGGNKRFIEYIWKHLYTHHLLNLKTDYNHNMDLTSLK